MLEFYRKAVAVFFGLAALTALLAYICIEHVFVSDALLPAHESAIPWKLKTFTDAQRGGTSSITVTEEVYSLNYEYRLTEDTRFPSVTAAVALTDPENAKSPVDLSRYFTLTFRVKCAPRSILTFSLRSFDERAADPGDFHAYRVATDVFSCHEEWSQVEIDLKHLQVPVWWLGSPQIDAPEQTYRLDKAAAIAFDASRQGPLNIPVKVDIGEMILQGRDWRYAWAFAGFAVAVWIGFISWFFRQYTASLIANVNDKLKKDRPLMAYQQLSIEPHRDKEKSQLLRLMATEYRNPDMSLEFAVTALGINRTKINELLKDELGMTFSAYLNKLRLAEAARLLSQRDSANVEEIAHAVGYSDVSYFRKLFKTEYGCTPGAFISGRRSGKSG